MTNPRNSFFMLLFTIVTFVSATDKSELAEKCIRLSGMDEFVGLFDGYIDGFVNQHRLTAEDFDMVQKIGASMKAGFDKEVVRNDLVSEFTKNTDKKVLKQVLTWYETPLALRITEAENYSSKASTQVEMTKYLAELQVTAPSDERVELMQRFVNETDLVELSTTIVVSIMSGVMTSMNLILPEEEGTSEEELRSYMLLFKDQIGAGLKQELLLSSYFTYREFSNEEISLYIDFLNSEAGKEFNKVAIEAAGFSLKNAFDVIAKELLVLIESDIAAAHNN